ncbi:MAG: hypothetical protein Q8M11_08630 [Sulfuritalea sp.]|nr:hypothetical protein [Sulfuritalea sp.]MDP1984991.1 hypothetical protein [Sulfuritalea sp.]
MQRATLLGFNHHRYLKAAGSLVVVAVLAYALYRPPVAAYGGTWLGYVLGSVAALLVFGQLWLGYRRRRHDGGGKLQAWVSAHVYFGAALVVLATLHSGFRLGWNVHTLAYVLMLAMLATGLYGIFAYLRIPRRMTDNMGEDSFEDLLLNIADLDQRAREHALHLPDEMGVIAMQAVEQTSIGGNVFRQLSGRHPDCPTHAAVRLLHEPAGQLDAAQAAHRRELYSIMLRKESLLIRARQDVAFRARLEFWLYLHAPLAVATVTALVAHIVATLVYR